MGKLLPIILIFLNCICFAGPVTEPKAIGEWSEPTNGLRARLLFAKGPNDFEGVQEGVVYLEIQNLSLGDSLYIYYSFGRSTLKCELCDSAGKTVENSWGAGTAWMPSACWLALPNDSTLRFRTGYSGSGPNHPCLFIISSFVGGKWEIPLTATNEYYLSGMFNATSPTNETRPRVWEGTLKLPPVKISVKSLDEKP